MNGRTAVVLGATGLVGMECVKRLLAHPSYAKVRVLVRRPLPLSHPKLEQHVVDFDRLEDSASEWLRGDAVFCCLGTTIKKAGSQEAFRKVDFSYAFAAARIAFSNGVPRWFLVSSVGADPRSPNFYLRVKGELEEALKKLGFRELHLFRPSLLLGERQESRPLEKTSIEVFGRLGFLFAGPLRKYRPVGAENVAQAMVQASQGDLPGVHVHERIA